MSHTHGLKDRDIGQDKASILTCFRESLHWLQMRWHICRQLYHMDSPFSDWGHRESNMQKVQQRFEFFPMSECVVKVNGRGSGS